VNVHISAVAVIVKIETTLVKTPSRMISGHTAYPIRALLQAANGVVADMLEMVVTLILESPPKSADMSLHSARDTAA
jgi:hypothetical protein